MTSKDEELYASQRSRVAMPLDADERLLSALLGGAFLIVAIVLALTAGAGRAPGPIDVGVLVLAFAALANVEFEIGTGAAIPTQLVFVPMLFLLPLGWVPLAVAAASWMSLNADVVRGRRHRERVLVLLCSCWYVVGPVLVLLAFGDGPPRWGLWPVYILALAAQFGADLASTALREWRAVASWPRRLLTAAGIAYGVDAALTPLGLLAAFASVRMHYAFLLVLPVAIVLTVFAGERGRRITEEIKLWRTLKGTVELLGDIIEADDAYTGTHSQGVVELVLAVSDVLDLSPEERTQAEFAALLHDVGKIRIPAAIINKAGPLDPEERAVIETHTIEGEAMLTKVGGLLGEIGTVVRSCHERWDGKGYPDRLSGEAIPLIARIVCCTDAFSAMTTNRPYRKARSSAEALAELRRCAGTHFDPAVVEAVAAVVG
ncbi:MAG TPA: HD-GYP domain-containing protein [Gaiellales bacterium]|nr:HD-GYP domain-containing protein [Gaiellales bacterium]